MNLDTFMYLYIHILVIFQPQTVYVSLSAAGAHLRHQVLYEEFIYFVKEVSQQKTVGLQSLLCQVHMRRFWQGQRLELLSDLETCYKLYIAVSYSPPDSGYSEVARTHHVVLWQKKGEQKDSM